MNRKANEQATDIMNDSHQQRIFDLLLTRMIYCTVLITVFVFLMAFLPNNKPYLEANTGDFSSTTFNTGWTIDCGNEILHDQTLPLNLDLPSGTTVVMTNTLPDYVSDGMTLSLRSILEDVAIFVSGEFREGYSGPGVFGGIEYAPSAYVVTELNHTDAGKMIKIRYIIKDKAYLSEVRIGYGNNVWFDVIRNYMPLTAFAGFMLILGVFVIGLCLLLSRNTQISKSVFYISLILVMMSIWMLSESRLRQLLFERPMLTSFFAYFAIENVAALIALYFDEVQHRKYHWRYQLLEILVVVQFVINIMLKQFGIAEMHDSLRFSHLWICVGSVVIIVNLVSDIRDGSIKSYRMVAIGMLVFTVLSACEMVGYYVNPNFGFGEFMCLGLLVLLFATIIQVILDELVKVKERENKQESTMIRTIETIASSIDAKDEYTGGHSNRVAEYAAILGREMAADYDFTENDITRIKYIGLMHDIGKIGVADTILNKAGRLSDEEFTLMKKHVEIGGELMDDMGGDIPGIVEGVRHHHERFDGKGYPDGLKGTDIPLIARILCLADCYDAMTSNRVYRRRLTDEAVRDEILRCAGTQFDPALAEIFVKLIDRGDMKPITLEGLEVGEEGDVLKSSKLERVLQHDQNREGIHILNHSHVRMLCYIIKLAEKRKKYNFAVLFVGADEKDCPVERREAFRKTLNDLISNRLKKIDMSIEYSYTENIVTLFGWRDEEYDEFIESFRNEVIEDCPVRIHKLRDRM